MRRCILIVILVLGLGVVGFGPSRARAQTGQPLNLPCVTGTTVQPLTQAMPSDAAGQALLMLRLTIAPGGGFAPHTHPGTVTVSIESGTLDFTQLDDHSMQVMRAASGATPAAAEPLTQGVATTLHPGDWVVEPQMIHKAFNTGDAPTVVLVSGLVDPSKPFVQCVEGTPTP